MPAAADPAELVRLAADVAREAGALLREAGSRPRRSVDTKSSATDLVTEVDRASEDLVVARLLAARPDDGVLAEEQGAREGTSGVRWVVDPLDGTTNFVYGHPPYAVSIAAEHAGRVVAGVVYDVTRDELFAATEGGGATCNGVPVAPRPCPSAAMALCATGFSYDAATRVHQVRVLGEVIGRIRDVRRLGAASVDLCWVACGRIDAYFERGLAPWDVAAGGLVAAEAGAVVTALDGGPPRPGSVLAATPSIAAELLGLLTGAGAHLPDRGPG